MINKKGAFSMTRDLQLTLFAQSSWRFIHNQAPKNTRTAHTNGADPQMPKPRKPGKKPIDQYDHKEASRANNPSVGLVTPRTDMDAGRKKTHAYDPHRSQIDRIIDDGIAAEIIEEAMAALYMCTTATSKFKDCRGGK